MRLRKPTFVQAAAEGLEALGGVSFKSSSRTPSLGFPSSRLGGEDYLRARGAGSAERLVASGLYQEMRRLPLGRRPPSFAEVERSIRNLITLGQTFLNFSRTTVLRDSDHEKRFVIEIRDAADYPEVLRFTSEGFNTACARAAGRNYTCHSSRPEPDRIVMHMDRDFDA